jgi:diadenosine tetraphosphatase ApaH/serine/threonine PP2A family protein phosphatase
MARTANSKEGNLIAFGHTHKPWHHEVAGIPFLNTGSVGKPKDGDWRVGYVLVEAEEEVRAVEFVRVEYDVERAAEGILQSTLPDEFADRLRAEETNILGGPRSESKWKVS